MKNIITKPHYFFFGLVPLFIFLIFICEDNAIDINIHDTYFVIANYFVCLFSIIFFALIGVNYFYLHWAKKPPKKWLTIIHLILQIISLVTFVYHLLNINSKDSFITNDFFGISKLRGIRPITCRTLFQEVQFFWK